MLGNRKFNPFALVALSKNKRLVVLGLGVVLAAGAVASMSINWSGILCPDTTRTYTAKVGRGEYEIKVNGDGAGDMDAYVYAADGDLLMKDVSSDDRVHLDFTSSREQTITVILKNAGNDDDEYTGSITP